MKYTFVSVKDYNTYQECMDAIYEIENDPNNVEGGYEAWNSGYQTKLLKGAQRKVESLQRRADKYCVDVDDEQESPMQDTQPEPEAPTMNTAKVIAYVRISDAGKQDASTQRDVIAKYAKEQDLSVSQWQEFHGSGSKLDKKQRGIVELCQALNEGDHVVISDVARLGRDDTLAVMETIKAVLDAGATLHFAYGSTQIDSSARNDIGKLFMLMGEAWAAVKFAEERSRKAKAAAERRRTAGLHNGRKHGADIKSKLDDHALFIHQQIEAGVSKAAILRQLEDMGCKVARSRFYTWLDNKLNGKGITKKTKTAEA